MKKKDLVFFAFALASCFASRTISPPLTMIGRTAIRTLPRFNVSRQFSTSGAQLKKVAVLGASGGIGQPVRVMWLLPG